MEFATDKKYYCYNDSGKFLAEYETENSEYAARKYFSTIKKKEGGETVYVLDKNGVGIKVDGFVYRKYKLENPIEETIYDNITQKEFKVVYRYDTFIEKISSDNSLVIKILGLK